MMVSNEEVMTSAYINALEDALENACELLSNHYYKAGEVRNGWDANKWREELMHVKK